MFARLRAPVAAGAAATAAAVAATAASSQERKNPLAEASKLNRQASVYIGGSPEDAHVWSPPSRADNINRLKKEEFDILVIGGGATGTGVAMDASTRGLTVALIERDDFASGTSSRSTKLIHGGLRYLAQAFQAKLPPNSLLEVFINLRYRHEYMKILNADLYERKYMIDSAAFMTRPLPIMVPMYRWWEVPFLTIAGWMYDFIAGRRRAVPPSHFIPRAEVLYQFPGIKEENHEGCKLKGALVFNEGQQNDTRMNVHIALTAAQNGAALANHTAVESLLTEGGKPGDKDYRVVGARVKDVFTGETYDVRAKQVINAAGVFSDAIRKMAEPEATDIMVAGPGTHLVTPDYTSPNAMGFMWFTEDGRVLYLLPWEGSTLAGTTDNKGEVTDKPQATMDDVDFILGECNRVLKEPLDYSHVKAAWNGLRPLVRDPDADPSDTKKLSRDHVVDVRAGGLVTICGGKWTTYRAMAQDAIDKALSMNKSLKPVCGCQTLDMTLIGSDRSGEVCEGKFDKVSVMLREEYDMDKACAEHLRHNYGTRALLVAKLAKSEPDLTYNLGKTTFFKRLSNKHPLLEAEVVFACREEYACTAVDVLARRTRLSFLDAKAAVEALPRVLDLMQKELKWSSARKEQERKDAVAFLETMYMPSAGDKTAEEVVKEVINRGASRKLVRTMTTAPMPAEAK